MEPLTFIDLYCGMGGFRIALENEGLECVWACDNDKWASLGLNGCMEVDIPVAQRYMMVGNAVTPAVVEYLIKSF